MRSEYQFVSYLLVMVLTSLLMACNREKAPDCFQAAGSYTTEKRELEEFSSIELRDYINIELYDSSAYLVEVTAPKNLLPEITSVLDGGKLKIENRNTCNFMRSFKNRITVRIYAPSFPDIQNYSTGDITSVNTIDASYFKLENRSAAGTIRVHMNADSTILNSHTGVCDAYLTGMSTNTYIFSQGLGIVDAKGLASQYTFVNNSSINNVYVNATEYLFAYIQFNGNIYYNGSPNHIDSDTRGNGSVIQLQ